MQLNIFKHTEILKRSNFLLIRKKGTGITTCYTYLKMLSLSFPAAVSATMSCHSSRLSAIQNNNNDQYKISDLLLSGMPSLYIKTKASNLPLSNKLAIFGS